MGKNNIGNLSALSSPFPGLIKRMITTPKGFSLTLANAASKAAWQAAILDTPAKRVYLWPGFRTFNNASEKFVYDKTDLSVMPVRDGIPEFDIEFLESIYIHKAMRSHTGTSPCQVIFQDHKNRYWGQSDGVNFYGYDIALLNTETIMWSDGKTASKSPVKLVMVDSSQWDDNGYFIDAKNFANTLLPLTSVTLKQTANLAATIIKCTVLAADGTSIDGLAKEDFKLTSVAGANHAITAISQDATTGEYSLTSATAVATDILSMVAASALTIPGYEATNTQVIA